MRIAPIAAVAMLASCSPPHADALEAVRRQLSDPESAQFRNVREGSPGAVCGEVNAKNKMGGYGGFLPFVVQGRSATIQPDASMQITDVDELIAATEQTRFVLLQVNTGCSGS